MKASEMVYEYLKKQGLCPEKTNNEVVVFKYKMASFLYFIEDDDETFLRLSMPGIYDVTEYNRIATLEAVNEISFLLKVIKAYIPVNSNEVWLSAEVLLDGTPELDELIPRLFHLLFSARERFYSLIS